MGTIRVRGPGPKKVHGNTGRTRKLAGTECTVLAVDECTEPTDIELRDYQLAAIEAAKAITEPPIEPVEVRIDNVRDILAVFGMVGEHERRGQGWHRTFIHIPQPSGIPLSIGRVMFQDGQYSHIKWYVNSYGDIGPLDFYMFGVTFYIATGIVLDAPAWSDLCDRATTAAQAEYEGKVEQRRLNPAYDRHGNHKRRRALSPPNPVKHVYRILNEYVESRVGRPFACLYI
uniref:Uncharacterized protein n=1 Tax=Pseudomonas phage Pavpe01 TaxID=3138545 RepID=A0AAU6W1B8_9VIRU